MQTYQVETTISNDRTLTIKGLPFKVGAQVQVIVHSRKREQERGNRYPLRGKPIRYTGPFASVAENDWNALQ